MMFRLPLVPLRRYHHGAGRAVRDAVAVLLSGMRPGRHPGGSAAFRPAPEAPVIPVHPEAGSGAREAWSRFQSGLAAGG
jgi:hypothetical protein